MTDNLFSDSDSDVDMDLDYDSRDTAILSKFREFLDKFKNEKGDSTTTIVDRFYGCFGLQPNTKESKKFFEYLHKLDKAPDMMYEKQSENRGGLMIDLDMYFKKSTVVIKPKHRKDFCEMVSTLMFECFEVKRIHQAVIVKPLPMKDGKRVLMDVPEKKCFKDGFHVLVPNVLMTKDMRKFFLSELHTRLKGLESWSKLKFVGDVLDQASAYVGVHFVGSASKKGKKPYELENVFCSMKSGEMEDIKKRVEKKHNVVLEFSVNQWGGEELIKKQELAFNEETMPKFCDFMDQQEEKQKKSLEDDQKYAPNREQLEEVENDEVGFIGHIATMIESLPDSIAKESRTNGGG